MASVRIAAVVIWLGMVGTLVAIPPSPIVTLPGKEAFAPPADPFPIRRVYLTPSQYTAKKATPEGQAWETLSLSDFETRVRTASRAANDPLPQLTQASYTATLGEGILRGEGTISVVYPTNTAGFVAMEPLRLALNNAQWDRGGAAQLLRPNNGPTLLWADPAQGNTIQFQWSVRAVEEPEEFRFDFRVPQTPIATLTLELPTGTTPGVSRADVLVTGPTPAKTDASKLWNIHISGQTRLVLSIRKPATPNTPPPLVKASLDATATLTPGLATLDYDWTFDAFRGSFDEWVFETDPAITITRVTTAGLKDWTFTPGKTVTDKGTLRVRLSETETEGRVAVGAIMPLAPDATPWMMPRMRMVNSIPAEETLAVEVKAPLEASMVDAGEYTPITLGPTFKFIGGLAKTKNQTVRVPVSLSLKTTKAPFRTQEDWVIARLGNKVTLDGKVVVNVLHGPVNTFKLRLPAGFSMVGAIATEADATAEWKLTNAIANEYTLSPSKAWNTGASIPLTVTAQASMLEKTTVGPVVIMNAAERAGRLITTEANQSVTETWTKLPPVKVITNATPMVKLTASNKVVQIPPDKPETFIHQTVDHEVYRVIIKTNEYTDWPLPEGARNVFITMGPYTLENLSGDAKQAQWVSPPGQTITLKYELPLPGTVIHKLPTLPGHPGSKVWNVLHTYWLPLYFSAAQTWLVDTRLVSTLCWIISGIIIILGFVRRARMVLFGIALLFTFALLLTNEFWWPVFLPIAVSLVAIFSLRFIRARMATAAVLVAVLLPVNAADTDTATVYVFQNNTEWNVACPPVILERLATMARRGEPQVSVVHAKYEGDATRLGGTLKATWTVMVNHGTSPSLTIPLGEAKLSAMTINGERAFPETKPGGVKVRFNKIGTFTITAELQVPVTLNGIDREFKYVGLAVPQAELKFRVNSGSRNVTAPNRKGSEVVLTPIAAPLLQADLGASNEVLVRWRSGAPGARPGLVAQEFGVWDLSPNGAALTWACLVNAEQGSMVRLVVDVPAGLEPGRAIARSVDAKGAVSATVGVKSWNLGAEVNGLRSLILNFSQPLEGQAVVVVPFANTALGTATPVLQVPRTARVADTPTTYAVRTEGVTVEALGQSGAVETSPEAASKPWLNVPELKLMREPVSRAVKKTGSVAVVLTPKLAVAKKED